MTDTWKSLGSIAPGGTVLSVHARANGQAWLATGNAIWVCTERGWRPLSGSVPLQQVGFVAAAGPDWWVGGLTGELVGTRNGGRTWFTPWTDAVSAPITCVAVSPRYMNDATLLAGTSGAGILRSTDVGRRWLLSNFGLQEFTVLALATATDWSRREIILAGTVDGIYRSSGGGRGWKQAGLEGLVVQALAVSRDYAGNGVILAGSEGSGLFRLSGSGTNWEPAGDEIGREASVNGLVCTYGGEGAEGFVLGTDAGQLWHSSDGGDSWTLAFEAGTPILALSGGQKGQAVWAGTAEQGVLVSTDGGRSWAADLTLCAWGFRRLLLAADGGVLALAPTGGVWRMADAGPAAWQPVAAASLHEPILSYAAWDDVSLEARSDGVWRREGDGEPQVVLQTDAPVAAVAVAAGHGAAWAGTTDAQLWTSSDGGLTWAPANGPCSAAGQQLPAGGLAVSPEDGTPVVGAFGADDRTMTLWRLIGGRWERWLASQVEWAGLALAVSGPGAENSWAAAGGRVWERRNGEWQEVEISDDGQLVAAIAGAYGGPRYAVAGGQVFSADGEHGWAPRPLPVDAAAALDLIVAPRSGLLCLDAAGTVWQLAE